MRDVFVHSELHGQGGSPLGGESPHSSPPPVHHGVVQRHRGRLKSPQSGDRVRMDLSPGGSRSAGPQVASPPDPDTLTWLGGLRLAAVSC